MDLDLKENITDDVKRNFAHAVVNSGKSPLSRMSKGIKDKVASNYDFVRIVGELLKNILDKEAQLMTVSNMTRKVTSIATENWTGNEGPLGSYYQLIVTAARNVLRQMKKTKPVVNARNIINAWMNEPLEEVETSKRKERGVEFGAGEKIREAKAKEKKVRQPRPGGFGDGLKKRESQAVTAPQEKKERAPRPGGFGDGLKKREALVAAAAPQERKERAPRPGGFGDGLKKREALAAAPKQKRRREVEFGSGLRKRQEAENKRARVQEEDEPDVFVGFKPQTANKKKQKYHSGPLDLSYSDWYPDESPRLESTPSVPATAVEYDNKGVPIETDEDERTAMVPIINGQQHALASQKDADPTQPAASDPTMNLPALPTNQSPMEPGAGPLGAAPTAPAGNSTAGTGRLQPTVQQGMNSSMQNSAALTPKDLQDEPTVKGKVLLPPVPSATQPTSAMESIGGSDLSLYDMVADKYLSHTYSEIGEGSLSNLHVIEGKFSLNRILTEKDYKTLQALPPFVRAQLLYAIVTPATSGVRWNRGIGTFVEAFRSAPDEVVSTQKIIAALMNTDADEKHQIQPAFMTGNWVYNPTRPTAAMVHAFGLLNRGLRNILATAATIRRNPNDIVANQVLRSSDFRTVLKQLQEERWGRGTAGAWGYSFPALFATQMLTTDTQISGISSLDAPSPLTVAAPSAYQQFQAPPVAVNVTAHQPGDTKVPVEGDDKKHPAPLVNQDSKVLPQSAPVHPMYQHQQPAAEVKQDSMEMPPGADVAATGDLTSVLSAQHSGDSGAGVGFAPPKAPSLPIPSPTSPPKEAVPSLGTLDYRHVVALDAKGRPYTLNTFPTQEFGDFGSAVTVSQMINYDAMDAEIKESKRISGQTWYNVNGVWRAGVKIAPETLVARAAMNIDLDPNGVGLFDIQHLTDDVALRSDIHQRNPTYYDSNPDIDIKVGLLPGPPLAPMQGGGGGPPPAPDPGAGGGGGDAGDGVPKPGPNGWTLIKIGGTLTVIATSVYLRAPTLAWLWQNRAQIWDATKNAFTYLKNSSAYEQAQLTDDEIQAIQDGLESVNDQEAKALQQEQATAAPTAAPTTQAPTSQKTTTQTPTTQTPTTTQPPTTQPATQKPTTQTPTTQKPATTQPPAATQKPTTTQPSTAAPTQAPTTVPGLENLVNLRSIADGSQSQGLLRPEFYQGGADFVSEVNNDVKLNEVNEMVWQSFKNYNWESNQQDDNPLFWGLQQEHGTRFSGMLFGEEFLRSQKSSSSYTTKHLDPLVNASKYVPPQIQTQARNIFQAVVPYEGQAQMSDSLLTQYKSPAQTDGEFHDVFLPDWFSIPTSSPLEKFTPSDGTQYPDSARLYGLEMSINDADTLKNVNGWIYNTVT